MSNLSLPPSRETDLTGRPWQKWFSQVHALLSPIAGGGMILWSAVSKVGSNLTDIVTRNHNDLQSMQGGSAGNYIHMSLAEKSEITRLNSVISVTVSTVADDIYGTILIAKTGITVTLPPASADRMGKSWKMIMTVPGTCNVITAGSDTMSLRSSATEKNVIMNQRGLSLSFLCTSPSTWGIV